MDPVTPRPQPREPRPQEPPGSARRRRAPPAPPAAPAGARPEPPAHPRRSGSAHPAPGTPRSPLGSPPAPTREAASAGSTSSSRSGHHSRTVATRRALAGRSHRLNCILSPINRVGEPGPASRSPTEGVVPRRRPGPRTPGRGRCRRSRRPRAGVLVVATAVAVREPRPCLLAPDRNPASAPRSARSGDPPAPSRTYGVEDVGQGVYLRRAGQVPNG